MASYQVSNTHTYRSLATSYMTEHQSTKMPRNVVLICEFVLKQTHMWIILAKISMRFNRYRAKIDYDYASLEIGNDS